MNHKSNLISQNAHLESSTIAIIGLGYVGLPLAVEFGKIRRTIGFDINRQRVEDLKSGNDSTREVEPGELQEARYLKISDNLEDLRQAGIFIVTVPTPIDQNRAPDLTPLINASRTIGQVISKGAIVIYESTVYPGATEEDCIPIIEATSGLRYNVDFFAGYSPERINPGDKLRPLRSIKKVTSGSTPEVAETVDQLYRSIIVAGTHKASSIRVAEASKIIENTQRDVNIALVNELSMIFDRLGIDTHEVIEAAATKWNFIKLLPGLVGGHCIGVDPYYLVHKSMRAGHIPDIIRTAREINDGMARYFASEIIREMIQHDIPIKNAKVLLLGITFKENCPDLRNTKVMDLASELKSYGIKVEIHDPWIIEEDISEINTPFLTQTPELLSYNAVVLAVAHDQFRALDGDIASFRDQGGVVYDLKNFFPPSLPVRDYR
ncbi:MAG: Vi polysaccharide biosynthesis protein VipA/TviB [Betaproteobacteria bacterium HGW-Betaproteobacteria-16]|nr:MAG: Vi polysaccharide biosynthesis protein VipA/TviB [Betaproteobacteria bacterium HGW-Betaproteobacteria-16]